MNPLVSTVPQRSAATTAARVLLVVTALAVAGCGSNVPHSRVVAANGGVPVTTITPGAGPVSPDVTGAAPGTTAAPGAPGVPATGTGATTATPGGSTGSTADDPGGDATRTGSTARPGSGGVPGSVITASCKGTGTGTIKIGHNGPYSATGAQPKEPFIGGLTSWATYVNENGGICGRKVQVIVKDDGGSTSTIAANYKQLVEGDKVAAILNPFTQLSASAFVPYLESKGIPAVGGDNGTSDYWQSKTLFPVNASSTENSLALYKAGQQFPNGSKIAFLYCAEVTACSAQYKFQSSKNIPSLVGSKFVYAKQISLTQISFASECQAAKNAGAGVILAYGDATLNQRLATSCAQQGLKFGYLVITISDDMAKNADLNNRTITAVPHQAWAASNTPGIQFTVNTLRSAGVEVTENSVNAFLSALMLQQAITFIGDAEVTPASITRSLQTNIRSYTIGGTVGPTTFRAGAQVQGRCAAVVAIMNNRWVPRNGGNLSCRVGPTAPLP